MALNNFLVIDIEATCWKQGIPPGEQHEIIEIGLAIIDIKRQIISTKDSIIVKPKISKISKYCTQLTTLTQVDVNNGVTFSKACNILKTKYNSNKLMWGSWGNYDYDMFYRQCKRTGVEYPLNNTFINLKAMYGIFNKLNKDISMKKALERESILFEGTHHRGIDDAYNIAKLFLRMTQRYALSNIYYSMSAIKDVSNLKNIQKIEPHPALGTPFLCKNCNTFLGWSKNFDQYTGPIICPVCKHDNENTIIVQKGGNYEI